MATGSRKLAFCLLGLGLCLGPGPAFPDELANFLARQTKPITLNVTDADIGTVLKTISRAGEFDVILSSEVNAKVSVRLKEVPVGVALARVLELGGIEAGVSDGVLLAYPRDGVRIFRLKHAAAQRIQDVIKPFLSATGKLNVDTKTNSLIVKDTAAVLNQIQRLLGQLDRKPSQVNVEAAILTTRLDDVTNLGVNFQKLVVIADDRLLAKTSGLASTPPTTPNPGTTPNGLFLSYARTQGGITALLEALQQTTDFKVLSHPRLRALSGEAAQIKVGQELGFLTSTVSVGSAGGAPTTTQEVQFLNVGTILKFTAQVSEDGVVDLELKPEVSDGNIGAGGLPSKSTSELATRVRIRSGETLLLGGLIRTRDEVTENKVPLLGSIPLLGALFRSKSTRKASDEVVIMITPTIEPDSDEPPSTPKTETAALRDSGEPETAPKPHIPSF